MGATCTETQRMSKNNLSGFRDFLPSEMIARQQMVASIQEVYQRYGFAPLQTPALERRETLQGKYGPEAEKLMYQFKDNGGRELAMRYDLTVPLARVIGQYGSEVALPFKRYQVAPVWRGESPQAGRYREFYQFDADSVGVKGTVADAEMLMMIADVMVSLGVSAKVRVNNRLLLDGLVAAVSPDNQETGLEVIRSIDKLDKIGKAAVLHEVTGLVGAEATAVVAAYLELSGTTTDKLMQLQQLFPDSQVVREGATALRSVFDAVVKAGYTPEQIEFDPTIARGLDYYTGIIYETTLVEMPELGSVCSGGRYDNLIKQLGGPDLPAVGISIGVDRLFEALRLLGQLELVPSLTTVLVAHFEEADIPEYFRMATKLRQAGITTELYPVAAKLAKQFKYADKQGIAWVVLLGETEKEQQKVTLKNMSSGQQELVSFTEVVAKLQA